MKLLRTFLPVILLFSALSACGPQPQPAAALPSAEPPTATLDLPATQSAQSTGQARDAQATQEAAAAAEQQATASAQAAIAATAAEKQGRLQATRTAIAANKATATAGVQATATAYAQNFLDIVQGLYEDGKINTTAGEYVRIDPYERSEAQINYFFPDRLNYQAENFVFSTKMVWSVASDNANWFASGCGVLFGMQEDDFDDAVLVYLGLDGFMHGLEGYRGGWPQILMKKWGGEPAQQSGEAVMMVVQSNKTATIYVNGQEVGDFFTRFYKPGDLGLTVISGTNKGYGTRCILSDTNLFILEK